MTIENINYYIQHLDNEQEKVEQELLDVQSGKMRLDKLPEEIRIDFENWLRNEEI